MIVPFVRDLHLEKVNSTFLTDRPKNRKTQPRMATFAVHGLFDGEREGDFERLLLLLLLFVMLLERERFFDGLLKQRG